MSYRVIPVKFEEHREVLIKLWKENSYDPLTNDYAEERFAWLYHKSPVDSVGTWLAVETATNTVIGCGSVFRSNRYVAGACVGAGMPAVFMVDKNHRTAGAALAIQRAVVAGSSRMGMQLLVAKPNDQSRAIFERVGYRPTGEMHGWTRLTGSGTPSDRLNSSDYIDETVTVADKRFDELWTVSKSRYRIMGEKTAAFLNWRYTGFKENYRYYCLVHREDRRLVGYIVFYTTRKRGSIITEFLCEDLAGPIIDRLLLGFASRMKSEGQEWVYLSSSGSGLFDDELRRLGFQRGEKSRTLWLYVDPAMSVELRNQILDENNWLLFAEEMDVLLSHKTWPNRALHDTEVILHA